MQCLLSDVLHKHKTIKINLLFTCISMEKVTEKAECEQETRAFIALET